jgi:hypothetical protein
MSCEKKIGDGVRLLELYRATSLNITSMAIVNSALLHRIRNLVLGQRSQRNSQHSK